MNVLVIGTGAIGSFYGSLLARQGHHVGVVARADYERIRTHGIWIRSERGDYHFRPDPVLRSAKELATKPDYVLLCVKVVPGVDRVGLLREALGPDTTIVLIANGVDIESEVDAAFPNHEIISGLAFVCVTRTAPGEVWHQAYGRLVFGPYPAGEISERLKTLCAAFESAGIPCSATEDIATARWQKCVWNAAFNPLSVLSGGLATCEILSHQESLVRAIMEEICSIAAVLGHPLPGDIADKSIASTKKMPPYKTSMLVDLEAGKPMETEAILGNAVRAGRRAGIAIPHLESLYALMKLKELQLENTRRSAT
ncbi:MAG TPA: 2-dehydropantoate 2-reductase [Methylococcus sp.]|nr:2-dehydropantoate 2-reductase [Methylococcus sp.]